MKLRHPDVMTIAGWRTQFPNTRLDVYKDEVSQTIGSVEYIFPFSIVKELGRIEKHGKITISQSGARDPNWREGISRELGVKCGQASDFSGTLFCPYTQTRIPVNYIKDNPCVWADAEYGIAGQVYGVSYAAPDAPPVFAARRHYKTGTPIFSYSLENRVRYKDVYKRLMKIGNECRLRLSLTGGNSCSGSGGIKYIVKALISVEAMDTVEALTGYLFPSEPPDSYVNDAIARMAYAAEFPGLIADDLKLQCRDYYTSDTLIYKPKP